MDSPIEIRPAAAFSLSELAAIWRDAYAGYYVPLQFDEKQLSRHLLWSGIDLQASMVGLVEGEPFGLSLAALDGTGAWIGGFGVGERFRRRGLATALLQAHAARLDTAGVASARLEVIDINPARLVYRRAGFAETRELMVYEGELGAEGEPGEELDAAELAEAHGRLHAAEPTWRRGLARLRTILREAPAVAIGVRRDGEVAAFAVAQSLEDRFGVFDAAAADFEAARRLLEALAAMRARARVRVVDEPETTPLGRALVRAGFKAPMRQFEMRRPRGG
jgi:ribosomal protein S18 acetylase RimI-like enzyme